MENLVSVNNAKVRISLSGLSGPTRTISIHSREKTGGNSVPLVIEDTTDRSLVGKLGTRDAKGDNQTIILRG